MDRRLEALRRAVGVTRVARVTGLDRCGVEVACAVRPAGHVLQVSNGKGLTWEDAARGAVLEAAELAAAETVRAASLRWASAEELLSSEEKARVVAADTLGPAGAEAAETFADPSVRMAWREGIELFSGARAWVPAQAIHCPPQGTDLGAVAIGWTTNGMGAHLTEREPALLHALLEACERDQLARAAPVGLDVETLLSRRVIPQARLLPHTAARVQALEKTGFEVVLLDLAPEEDVPGALGLPVAGALLLDRGEGPIPMTAGYACRPSRDEAFLSALLEAAQSRLTDIHGAREDVDHAWRTRHAQAQEVTALLRSTPPTRSPASLPRDVRAEDAAAAIVQVLRRIRKTDADAVVAVDVAEGTLPAHIIKVVVPSFLLSDLLL